MEFMNSVKKKFVYFASKLFSPSDRLITLKMSESLCGVPFLSDANFFIPYRDSNEKVDEYGDVAKNIFNADIKSLLLSDMLICRIDGLSYDSGVGFEIGFCFGKQIPIVVFSLDFYDSSVNSKKIAYSPMLSEIAHCPKFQYSPSNPCGYKDQLKENIEQFLSFINKELSSPVYYYPKYLFDFSIRNNNKYDVFIDFSGLKYEWCKILIDKVNYAFSDSKISFWVSSRYHNNYTSSEDIESLCSSMIYFICLDESEPNFDSSIIEGLAYSMNKYIVGYESQQVIRYVENKQKMGINLMNEKSCNYIASSLDDAISHIKSTITVLKDNSN